MPPPALTNLTQHPVAVRFVSEEDWHIYEPSGTVARLEESEPRDIAEVGGIQVRPPPVYGPIEPVDMPKDSIIVSMLCAIECVKRGGYTNVYSPDSGKHGKITDESGRMVGTYYLIKWC